MVLGTVEQIAKAITEVFKLLGQYLSGKKVARLEYQIEAAQEYIFVDEKSGEYKDIDDKRQAQLKLHFRKRVFDSS